MALEFLNSFKEIGSGIFSGLYYLLYLVPIAAFLIWISMIFRNRKLYRYPVRIFKVRENGSVLEHNVKGGYIGRKNSAPFFRIKLGWFKSVDLTTTPDPKYMDEQDRVYYRQIDVDSYVQLRREFGDFIDEEGKKVVFTPVESDVKYGAILSVHRIKEVLRTEPTWKKILPYAGMVIVAVVLITGYAILLNTKCPV